MKIGEETLRNNLQIKFAESFTKLGLISLISNLNIIILLTFPLSRSGSEADEYDWI